jgi:hypothetical protein
MGEQSFDLLSAVREIRDLLRLMAEPAIAERDRTLRNELRRIVGKSVPKAKAAQLMDGNRTQTAIHQETGIHRGDLSTLVKQLDQRKLLSDDKKQPKLLISIPSNFFESGVTDER